jgi:carbamoyl-phosphate synthase large subunit
VEYTVDIFSDQNFQTVNMVPRIRERVRAGVSDVGRIGWNEKLLALLRLKAPLFRLQGPWNIQCIQHQDNFYFLEVNPRFSGGIPLTIEAGADFCVNLLEWATDKPLSTFNAIHRNLVMMKYESEHFLYE